ncbi:MAG: amidohydrolase family protein [Chloroflexi bacterium]|nr:amidohydrolase family protein [Chloroflexota bacterium]
MKAIQASRLIDGLGNPLLLDPVVLIDGNRIVDVFTRSQWQEPAGMEIYRVEDGTILPGLIDAHVHLTLDPWASHTLHQYRRDSNEILLLKAARHAQQALAAGVTTVRDLGARDDVILTIRSAIESGVISGPHLIVANRPITCLRGHCYFMHGEVANVDEMRSLIHYHAERGVEWTKIIANGGGLTPGTGILHPQFSPTDIQAAVDESHRLGLRVSVHVDYAETIQVCAQAGADTLEHCSFLTSTGLEVDTSTLAILEEVQPFIVPTLATWYAWWQSVRDQVNEEKSWSDVSNTISCPPQQLYKSVLNMVRQFHETGLPLVAGSDFGCPQVGPDSVITEIEMFHQAGLSPLQAIQTATGNAAEALGLRGRRGTITRDGFADMLIIHGDPLANLQALRKPALVLKEGRIVAREGVIISL